MMDEMGVPEEVCAALCTFMTEKRFPNITQQERNEVRVRMCVRVACVCIPVIPVFDVVCGAGESTRYVIGRMCREV